MKQPNKLFLKKLNRNDIYLVSACFRCKHLEVRQGQYTYCNKKKCRTNKLCYCNSFEAVKDGEK